MTLVELRAGVSLAAIFAMRMLGLFLILPVFSGYAHQIISGDSKFLVGLAMGAFAGTQACLHVVYGVASDRFGRKPVILFGLALFVLGSVVAALAHDNITIIIVGRFIQGAGAVSAAVTALAADLIRDQHRTKVMAMIGSSIALMFALSMVLAPVLYGLIGMSGIFWVIAALALGSMGLTVWVVPGAPRSEALPAKVSVVDILTNGELMRLNFGVFTLHLIQMMMWVSLPIALATRGELPLARHWIVYLPAVLIAMAIMVPAVILAEKHGRFKQIFISAVALLVVVQLGLYGFSGNIWLIAFWLTLFFVAFNILEATQPSWISRVVSPGQKGAALGVYNTMQSIGIFLGGGAGGVRYTRFGEIGVGVGGGVLALIWLFVVLRVKPPKATRRN